MAVVTYGYNSSLTYNAHVPYEKVTSSPIVPPTQLYVDTVAQYRYFTTDLLTNQVLAEIPFRGVSFERSIKSAGAFSGTIPVIPDTSSMNIYDSTMPGKTGLYVVRDGVCLWGGIVWHRSYDVVARSLSVSASEFTSYFHHRDIWKTWSHDFGADLVVVNGTITGTLQALEYDFPVGSAIKISFAEVKDFQYTGYYTIATSPSATTFTVTGTSIPNGSYPGVTVYARVDTYDFVRQLLDEILVDFSGISFPNTDIEPALATELQITSVAAPAGVTTITTATAHSIIPTQTIEIYNVNATLDGLWDVVTTPSTTTFTIGSAATATVSTTTRTVTSKSITDFTATLTTSTAHGFTAGSFVTLSGVDDPATFLTIFDGKQYIVATPTSTTFTIYVSDSDMAATAVAAGTAVVQPTAKYGSYGPFPGNSDIDIAYSTDAYSGKNVPNTNYRGYELKSVGEELDTYSDTVNGFEYRIDCDLVYVGAIPTFTRTFVLIAIDFPNPPAPGEVSPPSRYGADQLVFEYPGSIINVTMEENAEHAATRFFVVGNIPDLGSDASQPYAVATATDMLLNGWPLLDANETRSEAQDEELLYSHAERYLTESRPPISDIKVRVNGSLSPVIGEYVPGDWCSIIVEDEFIRMRLASDLEVRDTVIVRKIDAYSVTVPDTPSFGEEVELTLVTEAQVDKRGQ
jgi:hypothetical protein